MTDKKKKPEEVTSESAEDTTMYDEFIPSYYSWLPSEVQRERAKHLGDSVED